MGNGKFFLTKEVVERAVQRILHLIEICKEEVDYQNHGFSICVMNDTGILFQRDIDLHNFDADYGTYAIRKAETALREKSSLVNLINKTPGRLEEGDPIYSGGVYSAECKIAIGVSGFVKAEFDDGIASLILAEIKKIIRGEARDKFEQLKSEGKIYLA